MNFIIIIQEKDGTLSDRQCVLSFTNLNIIYPDNPYVFYTCIKNLPQILMDYGFLILPICFFQLSRFKVILHYIYDRNFIF